MITALPIARCKLSSSAKNSCFAAWLALLVFSTDCVAQDAQVGIERAVLPPLNSLVALHGKATSSPEFLDVKQRCGLKLYFCKQELIPAASRTGGVLHDHNQVIIHKAYGGSGLIVSGYSIVYVKADLDAVNESDAIVERVKIVVGNCRESDLFGNWRGEMPPIELPSNPEVLLKARNVPDEDLLQQEFWPPDTSPSVSTRRISYYSPALANAFPYAFVFVRERLAMVEVWPRSVPSQIRQKTKRPNKSPEPTPTAVTPRAKE